MRQLARGILLGLAMVAAAPAGAAAVAWQGAMDECAARQLRQVDFNGVIAAGRGDERYWLTRGAADAAGNVPLTRTTPFRLASVGKLYTRVAIGLLVDAGKLKLEDPVRRHLPELPPMFAGVTIGQLLEHRSGVASMTRPDMADAPAMAGAKTARDLVALVGGKPLAFEPGSQEQYSNGGYLLLGAVVEAVSGETYFGYVRQHLFARLGMKGSGFEPGPGAAVPLTRMTGPGEPPATTPQPRMEFPEFKASSAGDALSSAVDLETFALALIGDNLLTASTKAAVFPRRSQPWRLGQAGGSVGSNTGFWVLPEQKAWLVVLSNYDPPAGELVGKALSSVLAGQSCQ